jgi:prepilin-type N-terminal cleavage/methylation domain-containing protein
VLGAEMKNKLGFSFVEVMVAMTILALIAVFIVPGFQSSIARSNVRKTSDLISELIVMSQSEALRQNVKIYLTAVAGDMCIGTVAAGCDVRREPLINGIVLTGPNLVLSPFYGVPSPSPAVFTISFSGVTQTVSVNRLGIVTVGPQS